MRELGLLIFFLFIGKTFCRTTTTTIRHIVDGPIFCSAPRFRSRPVYDIIYILCDMHAAPRRRRPGRRVTMENASMFTVPP